MKGSASVSVRRPPQQRRSRQTVEAVLGAVPLVLKRHGAAAVTTNRIAEVAGVSIGSLYQYFPDKRTIFTALQERHVERVGRVLERSVADPTSSSLDEFAADLVAELADLHAAEAELHRLVSTSVAAGPEGFRAALRGTFEKVIVPDGSVDTSLMLFALPSLVEGLVHGVTESSLAPGSAKDAAVRAVLAYLAVRPERSHAKGLRVGRGGQRERV